MEYGKVYLTLDEQIKKSGLSKTKVAQRAEMQRTQLNRYINNDVALLDKNVLGRLCTVLECDIADILKFSVNKNDR